MRGSSLAASLALVLFFGAALTQELLAATCPATHDQLTQALRASVKPSGGPSNGGLDNNEWAALVARDGTVCAVTFSGSNADDQWPGEPSYSYRESQHRQRIQPQSLCTIHGQSLRERAAWWHAVRSSNKQPCCAGRSLWR